MDDAYGWLLAIGIVTLIAAPFLLLGWLDRRTSRKRKARWHQEDTAWWQRVTAAEKEQQRRTKLLLDRMEWKYDRLREERENMRAERGGVLDKPEE